MSGRSRPDAGADAAGASGRIDRFPSNSRRCGRVLWRQDAVGADDFRRALVANDQMVAERVVDVVVDTGLAGRQPGAHFAGEDAVTQSLGFLDLALAARKADRQLMSTGRPWLPGAEVLVCWS